MPVRAYRATESFAIPRPGVETTEGIVRVFIKGHVYDVDSKAAKKFAHLESIEPTPAAKK